MGEECIDAARQSAESDGSGDDGEGMHAVDPPARHRHGTPSLYRSAGPYPATPKQSRTKTKSRSSSSRKSKQHNPEKTKNKTKQRDKRTVHKSRKGSRKNKKNKKKEKRQGPLL